MGERKVLNKYYPPDFNHEKLVKNKRPKDKQDVVRMMLPMSMRCNQCGNYLYIGTKFNMRKENCLNEGYLGLKILRFYFKCTVCHNEITFKTDPKNHDYVVEHGASRNYEHWRDAEVAQTALKEMREDEEEGNAMKYLENKTYDSKREMDIMDALDDIKQLNKRKAQVSYEDLLDNVYKKYDGDEEEQKEEEQLIKDKFKEIRAQALDDEEETKTKKFNFEENQGEDQEEKLATSTLASKEEKETPAPAKSKLGAIIKVKKVKTVENSSAPSNQNEANSAVKKPVASSQPQSKISTTTSVKSLGKQQPVSFCDYSDDDE